MLDQIVGCDAACNLLYPNTRNSCPYIDARADTNHLAHVPMCVQWDGVLRTKGFFWLASRHDIMGVWQSAGGAWQGEPRCGSLTICLPCSLVDFHILLWLRVRVERSCYLLPAQIFMCCL